jgi:cytochrome c oxidase subunit IV
MTDNTYPLSAILQSIFKQKKTEVKKRLIYTMSPLGGLDNKWIKILFFILPFAMYVAIFNPVMFEKLGIAQAIVFYIILLVVAMQIVIGVSYFNNRRIVKRVTARWNILFPTVDFKMILSLGVTPYVDFVKHYEKALKDGLDEEALKLRLEEAFKEMEEENHLLYEAMQRDKTKEAK